jgi:hypothetical protein
MTTVRLLMLCVLSIVLLSTSRVEGGVVMETHARGDISVSGWVHGEIAGFHGIQEDSRKVDILDVGWLGDNHYMVASHALAWWGTLYADAWGQAAYYNWDANNTVSIGSWTRLDATFDSPEGARLRYVSCTSRTIHGSTEAWISEFWPTEGPVTTGWFQHFEAYLYTCEEGGGEELTFARASVLFTLDELLPGETNLCRRQYTRNSPLAIQTPVSGSYGYSDYIYTGPQASAPGTSDGPGGVVGYEYMSDGLDFSQITILDELPGGLTQIGIEFNGQSQMIAVGIPLDFTSYTADGVASFRLTGFDPELPLDPGDEAPFGIALKFVEEGVTIVTQSPIVVPEPSTLALLTMGTLTLTFGWWRRRRAT